MRGESCNSGGGGAAPGGGGGLETVGGGGGSLEEGGGGLKVDGGGGGACSTRLVVPAVGGGGGRAGVSDGGGRTWWSVDGGGGSTTEGAGGDGRATPGGAMGALLVLVPLLPVEMNEGACGKSARAGGDLSGAGAGTIAGACVADAGGTNPGMAAPGNGVALAEVAGSRGIIGKLGLFLFHSSSSCGAAASSLVLRTKQSRAKCPTLPQLLHTMVSTSKPSGRLWPCGSRCWGS